MKKAFFAALIAAILCMAMSCTTGRSGCYATQGMSGYGHR